MGEGVLVSLIGAIFTGIAAAGQIFAGINQKKAADAEADLQREQGVIASQEAQAESQRVANSRRKFRKKQKLAFLKNGVTLAGSPLLILEETIRESQAEVNAIARRGSAQAQLAFKRAAITENTGRAALLSGVFGAVNTVGKGVKKSQKQAAGAFGGGGGGASASAVTTTQG